MSFFAPRTARESLWASSSIVFVFGLGNMRVHRGLRFLYAMIMTVIIVYAHVCAITTELVKKDSMVRYVMTFITLFKIPAGLVTIWLWEFKGSFAVENAIVELEKMDEELRNFGVKLNHRIFMWKQLITVVGFLVLESIVVVMQQSPTTDAYDSRILDNHFTYISITISIHLQYIQALVADLVFLGTLKAFHIRFRLVNEVFGRIAESEDPTKPEVSNTSLFYSRRADDISGGISQRRNANRDRSSRLVMEMVDRACRIHRRLLKAAQDVGDAFSLHLFLYYPTFFLFVTIGTLSMLSFIISEQQEKPFVVGNAITVFLIVGRFWQVVTSCAKTSEEANKLGSSLYRVPINDAAVHDQLREHSVHAIRRKLRFTAGGIFDIDHELATTIFTNTVKYIVILLQFQIHGDKFR